MATKTRIYIVNGQVDEPARLVEAATAQQAISHVVKNRYTAAVASQQALVELIGGGTILEHANAAPADATTE